MERIISEVHLKNYEVATASSKVFFRKNRIKSHLSSILQNTPSRTIENVVGIVQLIQTCRQKADLEDVDSINLSYFLRFKSVRIINERNLSLQILLSQEPSENMLDEKIRCLFELKSERVTLENGAGGEWRGIKVASCCEFDQPLNIIQPLQFRSLAICKPSLVKPITAAPIILAHGILAAYTPPLQNNVQLASKTEDLNKQLLTVLQNEVKLDSLDHAMSYNSLKSKASKIFRIFECTRSKSMDFEAFKHIVSLIGVELHESKAMRLFRLIDDKNKGCIDEREFFVVLYIILHLRHTQYKGLVNSIEKISIHQKPSPIDVFYQFDSDRDNLLTYFEYEKAIITLLPGIQSRRVKAYFPVASQKINLEQFKCAWVKLADVPRELTKRQYISEDLGIKDGNIKLVDIDVLNSGDYLPSKESEMFVRHESKLEIRGWKKLLPYQAKNIWDSGSKNNALQQQLLNLVGKKEMLEYGKILQLKEKALREEHEARELKQSTERGVLAQQQKMEINVRTQEALRERDNMQKKRIKRIELQKLKSEEQRLCSEVGIQQERRRLHEVQANQELIDNKMANLINQKAHNYSDVLDYASCNLVEIPSHWYNGHDALKSLAYILIIDVSGNRIQELPRSMFKHLIALQVLNASNNQLQVIPEDINKLGELHFLDLHRNQISSIPSSLQRLNKLKILNLSVNVLVSFLYDANGGFLALEELNLMENALQELPNTICDMPSLQILRLRSNPSLRRLPTTLSRCTMLTIVDIASCNQNYIGKHVFGSNLQLLRQVDLRYNNLSLLPQGITNVPVLQELDTSRNCLRIIQPEIGKLVSLVVLRLSYNHIELLPGDIGYCVSLEYLDLSHNQLHSLPPTIGALILLTKLDVSCNKILKLPLEMGALVNLVNLDVSWNILSSLYDELGCLANLKDLRLSHNKLTNLPKSMMLWTKLEILCLNHNQLGIQGIPDSIAGCQMLKYLNLSHNGLSSIHSSLYKIKGLEVLNISANSLCLLPLEMMKSPWLQQLKSIDLSRNKIAALPAEFHEFYQRLQYVNIEKNPLQYLPEKWSNDWRYEDQYNAGLMHGYKSAEVINWTHDQKLLFPAMEIVYNQWVQSIPPSQDWLPYMTCTTFIEDVKEIVGMKNWQPRFQDIIRHYFFEFKYLGHASLRHEVPTDTIVRYEQLEQGSKSHRESNAAKVIEQDLMARKKRELMYKCNFVTSEKRDNYLEILNLKSMKQRLGHEKKLLSDVQHLKLK